MHTSSRRQRGTSAGYSAPYMRSHKEGRSTLAGGGAALSDVVKRRRVVGAAPAPHTLQLTSGKVSQEVYIY